MATLLGEIMSFRQCSRDHWLIEQRLQFATKAWEHLTVTPANVCRLLRLLPAHNAMLISTRPTM